jgi:hypothetical protein
MTAFQRSHWLPVGLHDVKVPVLSAIQRQSHSLEFQHRNSWQEILNQARISFELGQDQTGHKWNYVCLCTLWQRESKNETNLNPTETNKQTNKQYSWMMCNPVKGDIPVGSPVDPPVHCSVAYQCCSQPHNGHTPTNRHLLPVPTTVKES